MLISLWYLYAFSMHYIDYTPLCIIFANYAYTSPSTIYMHIFRGSLVYVMWESSFVIYSTPHIKDHKIWPSLVLLMSSFSVFDSKGGEFRGPKASINNLQVVMVREREDNGLWIVYVIGRIYRKQGLNL